MSSTTFSSSFLREINENFLGTPIYTLKKSYCNKPIVLGYWAGTSAGCDCRGIYDDDIPNPNKFTEGSCDSNETRANCVNYHSKSPINIIKYEGYSFCNDTDKDDLKYKYYLNNSVSKNEECANDFKSCGYLDTLDQKLCVKINEECPINDLYINNLEDAPKDYITIPLNHNKYLHYTNKNNASHIITRLKLSEDNEPCIYPGEFSWKYHHILEKKSGYCKTYIDSQKYDTRYIKIDKINKYDLYYENDIIYSIGDLPLYDFNELKLDSIYLYKRAFLGFEKKCMEKNKFSFEYFDSIRDKQLSSRTFIKINLILLSIIVFLFCCYSYVSVKEGRDDHEKSCLDLLLCILITIAGIVKIFSEFENCGLGGCVVLVIIHIIVFIFNLLSLINLAGIKINFNCGDHLTNTLIQELKKVLGINMTTNIIMIICSSFVVLIILGIAFTGIVATLYEYSFKWNLRNFLSKKNDREFSGHLIHQEKDFSNENCEKPKDNIINIPTPGVNDNNYQSNVDTPTDGQYFSNNNNNNNENLNNNNLENNYPPPPEIYK